MSQEPQFMHLFDECNPAYDAGKTVTLKVKQTLTDFGDTTGSINLKIQRTPIPLGAEDIVGLYPAPFSDNSPPNYLPHIALRSKTLPWESRIYTQQTSQYEWDKVWLALLLFSESEKVVGYFEYKSDSASLEVRKQFLVDILPQSGRDLSLLCHMRQIPESQKEAKLDDDGSISMIIGNRLPEKDQKHHVFLVSLENLIGLYNTDGIIKSSSLSTNEGSESFSVLHHWSFTSSDGGDFESVIKNIRYPAAKSGGVLRFGNLPPPAATIVGNPPIKSMLDTKGYFTDKLKATDGVKETSVSYHGPLLPCPPELPVDQEHLEKDYAIARAPEEFGLLGVLEYSYATAFELGRVLAISDQDTMDSLQLLKWNTALHLSCDPSIQDRSTEPDPRNDIEAVIHDLWKVNPDPTVINPLDQFSIQSNLQGIPRVSASGVDTIIGGRYGDIAGMVGKIDQLRATLGVSLESGPGSIDINSVNEDQLGAMFSELNARNRIG